MAVVAAIIRAASTIIGFRPFDYYNDLGGILASLFASRSTAAAAAAAGTAQ